MATSLYFDSEDEEEENKRLKCPICLETRRDCKMFQCHNGHLICGHCCTEHIKLCPTCRDEMPTKRIRNIVAERNIQRLPLTCQNNGCNFKVKGKEMATYEEHKMSCLFKSIACCYDSCGQQIPIGNYLQHLKKVHKAKEFLLADNHGTAIHLSTTSSETSAILKQDESVYVLNMVRTKKGTFGWIKSLPGGGVITP